MSFLSSLSARRLPAPPPAVSKPVLTAPKVAEPVARRPTAEPPVELFRSGFDAGRGRPPVELNPSGKGRANVASDLDVPGTAGNAGARFLDNKYRVPNEEDDYAVPADEAQRSKEEARRQELAVGFSIATGRPVPFTNSNGETEKVSVRKSGDDYVITASDGHELRVHAEEGVSPQELADNLAALTDYYTQVPEHLRDSVDTINLHPAPYRANYVPGDEPVVNLGLDDIDEMTFDHEFGHAAGAAVGPVGDSWIERVIDEARNVQGVPNGWEEAAAADGTAPSQYSNENPVEDFGESWLAYVEARERGPEALAAFEAQYPNRAAILEQVYEGTWEG